VFDKRRVLVVWFKSQLLVEGDIVINETEILQVAESTSFRAAAIQSVLDDRHEQQATEKKTFH
jgi:hypothetical protein